MALTGSQTAAILAEIRKCVNAMWTLFNYRWCPRELSQTNLLLLDTELRSFLEQFVKYPELADLLSSADAVQDALQEMISKVNFAADTFDLPSFLEKRAQLYNAYIDIFECISRIKEYLDASSASAFEQFPPSSASIPEWQAAAVLAQLGERLKQIWAVFHYEYRPRDIEQHHLLAFEAELREILKKIVTSPSLQKRLWSADKLQAALRETILQLCFAADTFDLPTPLECKQHYYPAHQEIRACLLQVKNNLHSR